MAGLLYKQDMRLLNWAEQYSDIRPRRDAITLGWGDDDEIRAVVIYDNFSPCDCSMHIASDGTGRWLRRGFLHAAFAHPFVQWEMRRVTGLVPARNKRALAFDLHLGFRHEGVCRHALPDDDIVVLGMLREECRYIPERYRRA